MTQESIKIFSNSKRRETVFERGVDSRDVFVELWFSFCRFFMYFTFVGFF